MTCGTRTNVQLSEQSIQQGLPGEVREDGWGGSDSVSLPGSGSLRGCVSTAMGSILRTVFRTCSFNSQHASTTQLAQEFWKFQRVPSSVMDRGPGPGTTTRTRNPPYSRAESNARMEAELAFHVYLRTSSQRSEQRHSLQNPGGRRDGEGCRRSSVLPPNTVPARRRLLHQTQNSKFVDTECRSLLSALFFKLSDGCQRLPLLSHETRGREQTT